MLLSEIHSSLELTDEQISYMHTVFNYVRSGRSSINLDMAVRKLSYMFHQCRYKGIMYRAMRIKGEINAPLQYILRDMHTYAVNNRRKLFGWSKRIDGTSDMLGVEGGIVITQEHFGLDVYRLYEVALASDADIFDTDYFANMVDSLSVEFEVLSSISNNVHLAGFVLDRFYDVSEYQEMLDKYEEMDL